MSRSEPAGARSGVGRHRLNELLGLPVHFADGRPAGLVNDVRVSRHPTATTGSALVVDGIVVDGGHAGSLLGYDRRREQGPWLVRVVVRRLHAGAGYVPWTSVRRVDWEAGRVELGTDRLDPLGPA